MCLNIKSSYNEENEKLKKSVNKKGLIKGYTLFFKAGEWGVLSVYMKFDWVNGWNHSSRYCEEITPLEIRLKEVSMGFHIFINKSDAKKYSPKCEGTIIRTVYFKPEHLIAVGTVWNNNNQSLTSAVVKDLYVKI